MWTIELAERCQCVHQVTRDAANIRLIVCEPAFFWLVLVGKNKPTAIWKHLVIWKHMASKYWPHMWSPLVSKYALCVSMYACSLLRVELYKKLKLDTMLTAIVSKLQCTFEIVMLNCTYTYVSLTCTHTSGVRSRNHMLRQIVHHDTNDLLRFANRSVSVSCHLAVPPQGPILLSSLV